MTPFSTAPLLCLSTLMLASGDTSREAADGPGATVIFHGGAVDASMAWRGEDRVARVRGLRPRRTGLGSGAVEVDFPVVPSLGQRAAPLVFDVPDGARVDVAANYEGEPALFAEDFETARPTSSEWAQVDGCLEAHPAGHAVHALGLRQWGDGLLRARCRRHRGAVVAVAVRAASADRALWWEGDDVGSRLVVVDGGTRKVVARDDRPVPEDRWFDLDVDAVGGEVAATLNGHGRLRAQVPWTEGRILLGARWTEAPGSDQPAAAFDDVALRPGSASPSALWRTGQQGGALADWQPGDGADAWRPGPAGVAHAARADGEGVDELLVPGSLEWENYLVTARFDQVDAQAAGTFGLVFRATGPDDWYRLAVDVAASSLVLSRSVGGQTYTLRRVALEPADDRGPQDLSVLDLSVQAVGFALEVLVGDQVVMRELDGAHDRGQVGLFASPSAAFVARDLAVREPATWVGSSAIVRTDGALAIHGAAPAQAGAEYWLALTTGSLPVIRALDRDGLPLWLAVEPDVAWFDLGRYVHRYNDGFRDFLGDAGEFRARVEWPVEAAAVQGDALGMALWIVDATGAGRRWR